MIAADRRHRQYDRDEWILKYNQLHRLTGEFALNGHPAEVETQRA